MTLTSYKILHCRFKTAYKTNKFLPKNSETLRNMFTVNYMKHKNLTEMERTELTTARKKPSNEELDVIDIFVSEFLNIVTRNNIVWKLARGYCLC